MPTQEAIKQAIERLSGNISTYREQLKPLAKYLASSSKQEIQSKLSGATKLRSIYKNLLSSGGAMKGAASIGALGTLGAGAAVVAGWAYPAKKLGEYLGKKSIEQDWKGKIKRLGERLKPKDFDVKSELERLNKLKSKEGFDKLPPEHQRKLIDDFIKGRSTIK